MAHFVLFVFLFATRFLLLYVVSSFRHLGATCCVCTSTTSAAPLCFGRAAPRAARAAVRCVSTPLFSTATPKKTKNKFCPRGRGARKMHFERHTLSISPPLFAFSHTHMRGATLGLRGHPQAGPRTHARVCVCVQQLRSPPPTTTTLFVCRARRRAPPSRRRHNCACSLYSHTHPHTAALTRPPPPRLLLGAAVKAALPST